MSYGYRDPNDRIVVAYYDHYGEPRHRIFDFTDLTPGSAPRGAAVREMDRFIEALEGQGCLVKLWNVTWWNRGYRDRFYSGREKKDWTPPVERVN